MSAGTWPCPPTFLGLGCAPFPLPPCTREHTCPVLPGQKPASWSRTVAWDCCCLWHGHPSGPLCPDLPLSPPGKFWSWSSNLPCFSSPTPAPSPSPSNLAFLPSLLQLQELRYEHLSPELLKRSPNFSPLSCLVPSRLNSVLPPEIYL